MVKKKTIIDNTKYRPEVTQVMEEGLDKNTVEMAPNFDDTEHEPTVLPVPFPVMLVNGATGIAAGYASNMPPHNLNEVVDATIYRIQNPESALTDVMDILTGPDFPTYRVKQVSVMPLQRVRVESLCALSVKFTRRNLANKSLSQKFLMKLSKDNL